MYIARQFVAPDNTTDTTFRAWGSAISAAFTFFGWSKTADTGQVNWSTATVPSSTYVYEIWQPGDALQTGATAYYLKVEYGFSSSAVRMRFSIGTSTNGSGTLTGTTIGTFNPYSGSTISTSASDCYFSGDINRFGMMMFRNESSGSLPIFMAVERTKDVNGADNSDGVSLYVAGGSITTNRTNSSQTLMFGVGAATLVQGAGGTQAFPTNATNPFAAATSAQNNNVPVAWVFPLYGKFGYPQTVLAFASTLDVAETALVSFTMYGQSRTFLVSALFGWNTNFKLLMRYD